MKNIVLGFTAVVVILATLILVPACAQTATPATPTPSAPKASTPTGPAPATPAPTASAPKTSAATTSGQPAAKPIKVSVGMPLTGPGAGAALHQFRGVQDYFSWTNDRGGIDGAPLDMIWADTQYKVPVEVEHYKRARDQGSVLHIIASTPAGVALVELAAEDKMPVINASGDHEFMIPARTMSSGTVPYPYQATAELQWFLENWKETRAPRIAWLGWDHPLNKGTAPLVERWLNEKLTRADGLKYQWTSVVYTAVRQSDFSTYLLKVKDLKPDVVILGTDPEDSGAVARDAQRLGLTKQWSWIFMNSIFFGPDTIKIAGPEAVEGWLYPSPFESVSANLPGSAKIREAQAKFQGSVYDDANYVLGWVMATTAVEGIKLAAKQVGVTNLNRQAVSDGMYRIKDLDTGGVTAPITLSKDKVFSVDAVKMWRIKEGKTVPASDWIKVPRFVPGL